MDRWNQLVSNTVIWLCAQGLLTQDTVPVASSKRRYIVNMQPRHPTGNDFWNPEQIEGLWVKKHGNTMALASNVAKLMAHCDQDLDKVQLRLRSDARESGEKQFATTTGCYQNRVGVWGWRLLIDTDMEQGRELDMPQAFAELLGCRAGEVTTVPSAYGPVTIRWSDEDGGRISMGSLQSVLTGCGARTGDYLFVRATTPQITFEHLAQDTLHQVQSDLIGVSLLLGYPLARDDQEALSHIAVALNVAAASDDVLCDAARQALCARNETELASRIMPPALSIDEQLARLQSVLEG